MAAGLAPALGGRLGQRRGGPLRASFVDSLELDHANWTDDLPAEFERRRGYDLAPYLPFVLERDDPADESPRADTVRRARYDFHRTVVELFRGDVERGVWLGLGAGQWTSLAIFAAGAAIWARARARRPAAHAAAA